MNRAELQSRTLGRLGDGASTAYPAAEVVRALDEGLRLFCALTLYVERRVMLGLTPGVTFYRLLDSIPDWFLPLRVGVRTGLVFEDTSVFGGQQFDWVEFGDTTLPAPVGLRRVKPATLTELEALDSGWQARPGTPSRYAVMGFDLLAVYGQPVAAGTEITITYAAAPAALAADNQVPEIPEEYHDALIDYAVYVLRVPEGAEEFLKGLRHFESFLDAADKLASYVRARSLSERYDNRPHELSAEDRSRLIRGAAPVKEAREVRG